MAQNTCQIWDVWIADTGATGMSFARGRLDPTDVRLVHAAPAQLNLEVHDDTGALLARGNDLMRTASTPVALLRRQGDSITREDIWPTEAEYGAPVLLPGGEVGILQSWWNDAEHQEWRWRVEFYNHRCSLLVQPTQRGPSSALKTEEALYASCFEGVSQ